MKINFTNKDSKLVIAMTERLDTTTAQYAEDKIAEKIGDNINIVFDFTELAYISSAGLRLLLAIKKDMGQKGGSVEIIGCNNDVKEIFEVTGFDSIFNMEASDEAQR